MLKKVGIIILIVASLGIAATTDKSKSVKFHKTFKESNQANIKLSNEDKEIINIAIDFVNEYIQLKNPDEFHKWFAKAPITEKFRKEYFRKDKYIDLKEKELYALTSESPKEKLTPAEKKFLKENDDIDSYYQHDALLGIGIGDIRPESEFLLKKYDSKSKTVHLKDKYEEEFVIDGRKNYQGGTEIILKLVKQNGKWLIDESK